MSLIVDAIDHLVANVTDVEVSAAWYVKVLGMTRRDSPPKAGQAPRTSVLFGQQKINLRPVTARQDDWFTGAHVSAGGQDLCFLTAATPQEVVTHLTACGVPVEVGPAKRSGALGTLISVYCRDPDGSLIEISSYEPSA
jgi:catechol 2,3-dioxygenase-like lactoylglutathione lyase family enzyme